MKRGRQEDTEIDTTSVLDIIGTPRSNKGIYDNPTRRSRIDECNHLQHLNKRLEFVLLKQREKEAGYAHLRENLDKLRNQSQKDIDELRNHYESQMSTSSDNNERNASDVVKLRDQLNRLTRDNENARQDESMHRNEKEAMQAALQSKEKEIQNLSANVMALEDRLNNLEQELSLNRKKLENAEESLLESRSNAATNATELSSAKLRVEQLLQDLKMNEKRFDDELKHTQEELDELLKERNHIEDLLRKEFVDQLKDNLADRQAQHEQDKDEMRKSLKMAFDVQLAKCNADLAAKINDEKALMQIKQQLEAENDQLNTKLIQLESANNGLADENKKLAKQVQDMSTAHKNEMENAVLRFQELTDMFHQIENDFSMLIDVKITLATEIKKYRTLLEKEEERLGYSRNSLYRKDNTILDTVSPLSVIHRNLDGTVLTFKNNDIEDLNLDGWQLMSKETAQSFTFPKTIIAPGKTFSLYFGDNAEKLAKDKKVKGFPLPSFVSNAKDTLMVFDNKSVMKNQVDFISNFFN